MRINGSFRARLLAGEFLAGSWLNLGSPLTAEMAGLSGFDWVMLDHEHGPGSDETIVSQLQAVAATPAVCFVRIAANEPPRFKRVLDLGAMGVMVPYVSTPAEAQAAVAAMRYPPRGIRGVAKLTRATTFGAGFDEYFAHAHEWLVTMTQIETAEAVENAAAYRRDRRRRRPLHWPDGSHDEPRHLRELRASADDRGVPPCRRMCEGGRQGGRDPPPEPRACAHVPRSRIHVHRAGVGWRRGERRFSAGDYRAASEVTDRPDFVA